MISETLIFILATLGFINTAFLRFQYQMEKRQIKKMYCFIGTECFNVLDSRYGRSLGLKNEDVGLIYYFILICAGLLSFITGIPYLDSGLILAIIIAALFFSIYLLIIQLYVLKKACFWCLVSIGINALIFGAVAWGRWLL